MIRGTSVRENDRAAAYRVGRLIESEDRQRQALSSAADREFTVRTAETIGRFIAISPATNRNLIGGRLAPEESHE